jgi:hypothetical protein
VFALFDGAWNFMRVTSPWGTGDDEKPESIVKDPKADALRDSIVVKDRTDGKAGQGATERTHESGFTLAASLKARGLNIAGSVPVVSPASLEASETDMLRELGWTGD